MSKIRLPFVQAFTDKTGAPRYYFRRRGCQRVPLPHPPGGAAFMAAYQRALDGAPKTTVGAARTAPGTISDLVTKFYDSAAWKRLKPSTAASKRGVIEAFRVEHGNKLDFAEWIEDRKNAKRVPHSLEDCGYVAVRNVDAKDGLWRVKGRRQVVYARAELALRDRLAATAARVNR